MQVCKYASIWSLPLMKATQRACSMGKTYTSSLLCRDYDNVIVRSPIRASTHQTLERFKEYIVGEYNR